MPAFRGPDGRIQYVSEDEAGRMEAGGYERIGDAAAGVAQNRIAPVDNGITGSIGATLSAGLSGATLGGSDWLLKGVLNKGQFEQLAQDRAANPTLAGVAQLAGAVLPAVVTGGAVTPSGYLSHLAAEGIAGAEAVGGAAGTARALAVAGGEGALQNAGIYLSDVALGDRELTAEGMTGALGTGFAFGGGGLIATKALSAGTVAARRMFARYAEGGEKAAADAQAAWQERSAKTLESFDQAATAAQTKLQEAQLARQQADLARRQAAAGVAEAKVAPLPAEHGATFGAEASAPAAAGDGLPEGFPRDYLAARGFSPEQQKAAHLQRELGRMDLTAGSRGGIQDAIARLEGRAQPELPADPLAALAELPGAKRYGPDTAVRDLGAQRVPGQHAVTADEADLAAKLREYQSARAEFDATHAAVDPELDAALRGSLGTDVQRPPVPTGEFGAPGARGFKSQEELARLAAGTDADGLAPALEPPATRALRAKSTPPSGVSLEDIRPAPAGPAAPTATIPDHASIKQQLDASGENYLGEQTIPARAIAERGYYEPPGGHADAVRNDKAAQAIAEGQREAIKLGVSPEGKITVIDGRHRLGAAIDVDAPVKVKWTTAHEPSAEMPFVRSTSGTDPNVPREIASEREFRKMQLAFRAKLTDEEYKQAVRYSREYYLDVNRHLRGHPSYAKLADEAAPIIPALDSALEKAEAPFAFVTHRGANIERIGKLQPGDLYEDPGYLSSTFRAKSTRTFGDAHLVIEVPKGTHVAPITSSKDEGEFLFQRGTKLRITAREELPGGGVKLHATVVGPEPSATAPADDLLAALQGTKLKLESGASLNDIGATPRAQYVADKAARTEEAARHFRAQALEARDLREPWNAGVPRGEGGSYETSPMAAAEREANALAQKHQLTGVVEPGAVPRFDPETRSYFGAEPTEHPLSMKRLEMAHDDAVERAATATDPAEKAAATSEAKAIEQQMTAVGSRPGAVEDVAVLAPVVHRLEKAATELTEALGEAAPAGARGHAAAFRQAEDVADQKHMARAARAADDHAAGVERAQADDLLSGPSARERAVAKAQRQRDEAEAAYQNARVAEAEASIGAKQAKQAAAGARASLPPEPGAPGRGSIGGHGNRVVQGAHALGYAAELGSDLGIPGIPRPRDIPVIGPLLSAYLKYRAFKAAAGRFVGRVPVTAETRAAELAARTRDGIARSMDRSLGLVERNPNVVRTAVTFGALKATEALSRRLADDGLPDAKDGASISQLAAVRIREVAAAVANPGLITDRVRAATRGVSDPELITALENHLLAMYQHLNDTAPKGPPPNPLSKQEWKPPAADALQWGQRVAVANNPQIAFDLLEAGKLTPAPAETLQICYQKLFAEAQARLAARAADLKNPVPYRQLLQAGLLFDTATHPSLDGENATVLQQAHVSPPQPAPQQPSSPLAPSIAATTNVTSLYQTTADRRAAR